MFKDDRNGIQTMKIILNREELAVGAALGSSFVLILGWWTLITAPLCAVLWSMGGSISFSKKWRRFGVPTVLCGFSAIAVGHWLPLISWLPLYGTLTLGYGLPCPSDPEPSDLGKLIMIGFRIPDPPATSIVRGIIGLLAGISMFTLAFFNPLGWLMGALMFMIAFPVIERYVEGDFEVS